MSVLVREIAADGMDGRVQPSVGIVGCGYWGPKLARNFHDLDTAEFSMAVDLDDERLKALSDLYPGLITSQRFEDLLHSDLDAIVIATPVHSHYRLAKAALSAGKHVLIEKPITASSDQAAELVQIAAGTGLTLMVGHTFEYNPAVETVKNLIESGILGRIFYASSVRANLGLLQPDINVVWDLAPHDVSILRFILGSEVERASARGDCFVNRSSRLHEVVFVGLRFENGVMAQLHLSWLDPVKQRRLTVVGGDKMLVYDDIANDKVVLFDKGVDVPPHSVTEEEFQASYRHGDEQVYPVDWREPLRSECAHFIDCVVNGKRPQSDGEAGLRVVKVLETAQRSLINGGVELLVEY